MRSSWPMFLSGAAASWSYSSLYDKACTIDERAFSGIRIQHEFGFQLYPVEYQDKHIVITKCDLGSTVYEFGLPLNCSVFDRDIHVPVHTEQLRISRRKPYQNSSGLYYVPSTLLGAVFYRSDDTDKWTPLSPLVADHWASKYWISEMRDDKKFFVIRTSLLRSPDVLEKDYPTTDTWKRLISPYENETKEGLS